MCAATRRCVARKATMSDRSSVRACPRVVAYSHQLMIRGIRTAWSEVETSMASPFARLSSYLTVNPVRQCARRWAVDLGVAQASPLFSDHAPREVHLWQ
jgi:hypothetical protein